MIPDTTFIIDVMNKLPEALRKAQELEERQEGLFVTTPTIYELWSGIVRSSRPEQEKKKVEEILTSQFILDLDKPSAEEAGKIDGTLQKEGATIEPEDCMIAGIARCHGEAVLTRNKKHFSRVSGLAVESY